MNPDRKPETVRRDERGDPVASRRRLLKPKVRAMVVLVSAVSLVAPMRATPLESPIGQPAPTAPPANEAPAERSSPLDARAYGRPALPSDANLAPDLPAGYSMVDVVVANTDPNLATTDTWSDGETSLGVNGGNTDLAGYTFSSTWGAGNAAFWHSTDGGATWTKRFTFPAPTGVTPRASCPCDVTVDFDRSSRLFATVLNIVDLGGGASTGDVYTGETTNPASAAAFSWHAPGGVAQKTENLVASGGNNADQPWVRITRDPVTASQDNTYVGYDDFTSGAVRVAAAPGSAPPNFTRDASPGIMGCCVNPGMRIGVDHSNGTVYALWQYATGTNPDGSRAIQYALSRSTDGGTTWTLNGSSSGIVIAAANSDQPTPKFGTVNALLGGVDAIGVNSANSDVYIVYGTKDAGTLKNRLAIRRLTANGTGGLTIGTEHFVTGQVQAALPSVAVANGTVGVLYDTYDGVNGSGFPVFTVHLAQSTDQGSTFNNVPLVTFASPVTDNADTRQRILGDYQQLRSLGGTFYGLFPANGAAFGRSLANIDPIFVKAPADTAPTAPGAPTGVTAVAGNAQAVVSWSAPVSNGGSAITGYVVTPFIGAVGQAPTQVGNVTSTPVTGLTNGTSYTFKVAAVNGVGTGPQSAASNQVTPQAPAGGGSVLGDFDGDGDSDFGVYRVSERMWFVRGVLPYVQWGEVGDIPVPGDYDGDGDTDIAVYSPDNGMWYVRGQSAGQWQQWGAPGSADVPVPADYDGDGDTDVAVYRPSTATFWVKGQFDVQVGQVGDVPVPGNYDQDAAVEPAVFRPSTREWVIQGLPTVSWGNVGDVPVPADYDGDGVTDRATYSPGDGYWWPKDQPPYVKWGSVANDVPVPGNYAPGVADERTIYRRSAGSGFENGVWYVQGQQSLWAQWGGQLNDVVLNVPPALWAQYYD